MSDLEDEDEELGRMTEEEEEGGATEEERERQHQGEPLQPNQASSNPKGSHPPAPGREETGQITKPKHKRSKTNLNPSRIERTHQHQESSSASTSTRKGKKPNVNRDHLGAHQRLIRDFFLTPPTTTDDSAQTDPSDSVVPLDSKFHSKFRLSKPLFLKIVQDLTDNDLHFVQRKDAIGNMGHSSYQKVLAAIRQLTHGIGSQEAILDDYIRMAESTALECLIRFCYNVDELYGTEYLRSPTESDLRRMDETNRRRGFPMGLVGCLNFEYWEWDNCPTGWSGRFKSSSKVSSPPTIVLEAITSHDSWFWSAFFSTPGNCKDVDVFHPQPPIYSPRFQVPKFVPDLPTPYPSSIPEGQPVDGYYLSSPIYPSNPPILIPSISSHPHQALKDIPTDHSIDSNPPSSIKTDQELDSMALEDFYRSVQKLESRFQIIKLPCRLWSSNSMGIVLKTVIILHNMIVEDERDRGSVDDPLRAPSSSDRSRHRQPEPDRQVHEFDRPPIFPLPPPALPDDLMSSHPLPSPLPSSSGSPMIPIPPSVPHHHPIPNHVFQKLNHRFQFFNPSISLIPPS